MDNLNGPMGLLVAISLGISQITYCNGDLVMALICVDYVTNLTIASGYSRGLESLKLVKIFKTARILFYLFTKKNILILVQRNMVWIYEI